MQKPTVSIITSTYNRSGLLRRAIDSVRAQRGAPPWEMCIVGDCTPDDTEAVVASYGDERLRFHNLPEKSPPRAHGAIASHRRRKEGRRRRWPPPLRLQALSRRPRTSARPAPCLSGGMTGQRRVRPLWQKWCFAMEAG